MRAEIMAEASSIAKPSWTLEAARVRLAFATPAISPLREFARAAIIT